MKYSKDRAISDMVRQLIQAGWRYHRGGRHGKLIAPSGKSLPVPNTPSDHRSFLNFKRDIRKLLPHLPI